MNADQLIKHFESIVESSDAIPRLRRFILNLAIRGKLAESDQNDTPKTLLTHIQAEREHRAEQGEAIKLKRYEITETGEFSIPKNWCWVKLGFITNIVMGQSPPGATYNKHGEGIPLVNGPVEFSQGPFGLTVLNQYTTEPTKLCKKGDLLLCVRGSTTGRTNIAGFDAYIGRGVAALQPLYEDRFVRLFIWSWRDKIISMGRGIAFPSISLQQIEDLPVPFPPLAEQHRIIAKVGELMALCDELEATQTKRETQRDHLVAATLYHLNNSDSTPDTFEETAHFYFNHLPRLTTRPEHIKQLRETILNLAVQGKLVPQDPNEESIISTLLQVRPDVSNLAFDGEHQSKSELGIRYVLPTGWAWLKGHRIADFIDPQPSHRTPPEYKDGIPYIGYADINKEGNIDFANARKVSPIILAEHRNRYVLKKGDFIIGKIGTIGQPFLLPSPFDYALSANIILVQPHTDLVCSWYLMLFISSPIAETALRTYKTDSTHAVFGIKKASELLVPVPPLAEQHRIVAKVDELMKVCNELETQLSATAHRHYALLEATLHHLLTETVPELVDA